MSVRVLYRAHTRSCSHVHRLHRCIRHIPRIHRWVVRCMLRHSVPWNAGRLTWRCADEPACLPLTTRPLHPSHALSSVTPCINHMRAQPSCICNCTSAVQTLAQVYALMRHHHTSATDLAKMLLQRPMRAHGNQSAGTQGQRWAVPCHQHGSTGLPQVVAIGAKQCMSPGFFACFVDTMRSCRPSPSFACLHVCP